MKNLLLGGVAAACLLSTACSKESVEEKPLPPSNTTERLYVEDETTAQEAKSESRAGFDGNGYHIAWSAGDEVMVNGAVYPLQKGADGSWYVEVASAEKYVAYYPALAYAERDGKVYMQLPRDLTFTPGSFDPKGFCARAEAVAGGKLQFKYLCSLVRFTVQGIDQTAIVSFGGSVANKEILAGYCEVVQDTDGEYMLRPVAEFDGVSQTGLTSQGYSVTQLTNEGTDYYFAIPPTDFSAGFMFGIKLADNTTMIKTKASAVNLKRADILEMPAFRFETTSRAAYVFYSLDGLNYKPWGNNNSVPDPIPYPASGILSLKDNPSISATVGLFPQHLKSLADSFRSSDAATAKPIEFDLSRASLYGTTTFPSDVFCGLYWDGVVDAGKMDQAVKRIAFPKNMTRIADMSLTLPTAYAGILKDRVGAFCGYNALEQIELPEGIVYIGTGAFSSTGLKSVTIPGNDGALTIGKYAFWNSGAITEVRCERTTPPTLVLDGSHTPFYGSGKNGIVFRVPAASLAAYQADANWQQVMAEGTGRTWATF